MPAPRKPAHRRQNRVTQDLGVVSYGGRAPAMPRGLCEQAQRAWRDYWTDTVSGVTRESDHNLVKRWIKNLDRYHRLIAVADREPMVPGSKGQPVANPIYVLVAKFEESIKRDEQQLGIGPLNRLKLGVVVGDAAMTLADLNAEADDDDDDDDDPRVGLKPLAVVPSAQLGAGGQFAGRPRADSPT